LTTDATIIIIYAAKIVYPPRTKQR